MSRTATGPVTGPLFAVPMQRASRARHRDPISGHEADAELPEDWSMPCDARHCSQACAQYRGPRWRAFEVRS